MKPLAAESILDLVGGTPMLRLRPVEPSAGAAIYAKLEFFNPGGSVKDRAALGMIREAERSGRLRPGSTLIEPTAGNTGIGLAMIGVQRGYRVILCVPENFDGEKVELMRMLGGEVVLVPGEERMEGAIRRARELAAEIPGSFIPHQYENPANPGIHYRTTGPEMFQQMEGRIDALVLGAGTSGTFSGVARFLKERIPGLPCYLVESEGSVYGGGLPAEHRVEGIGSSFLPAVLDGGLVEEVITVEDEPAFAMAGRLASQVGLFAGGSGGAAVEAAVRVAGRLTDRQRVATLIPDSCERYLSKSPFRTPVSEAT